MPKYAQARNLLSIILAFYIISPQLIYGEKQNLTTGKESALIKAANIYQKHCTQCHGNWGLGDGNIPTTHWENENTNLSKLRHLEKLNNAAQLKEIITHSFISNEKISTSMPPWKNKLTEREIDLLTLFLPILLKERERIESIIYRGSTSVTANIEHGRNTFETKCSLCHGSSGEGDGKLSKFITSPPPSNLAKSRLL